MFGFDISVNQAPTPSSTNDPYRNVHLLLEEIRYRGSQPALSYLPNYLGVLTADR